MKINIQVALVTLMVLIAGVSEARESTKLHFGFKAGLNRSDYLGNPKPAITWKGSMGAHVGIYYSIPTSSTGFQIQPELLFTTKGAHFYSQGNDYFGLSTESTKQYSLRQQYLELPVMAMFRAKGVYFELGPVLSLLLKANQKYDEKAYPNMNPRSRDITQSFNTICYGGAVGVGYMIKKGGSIGLRFQADFNEAATAEKGNLSHFWQGDYHNAVLQLSVGWLLSGRPDARAKAVEDWN